MIKEYKWKKVVDKVFKGPGAFPSHCPECGHELKLNDDYDYMSEWWSSYTCTHCKTKIRYMPTDMGQTLPQLERYESREAADKHDEYLCKKYENGIK